MSTFLSMLAGSMFSLAFTLKPDQLGFWMALVTSVIALALLKGGHS